MKEENTSIKQSDEKNIITEEINTNEEEDKPLSLYQKRIFRECMLILILVVYIFFRDNIIEFLEPEEFEDLSSALSYAVITLAFEWLYLIFTLLINPILILVAKKRNSIEE